jgi:hypothetical protein
MIGSIDGEMFGEFIENTVGPLVFEGAVGLLDNARTHYTVDARNALEEIFEGNVLQTNK